MTNQNSSSVVEQVLLPSINGSAKVAPADAQKYEALRADFARVMASMASERAPLLQLLRDRLDSATQAGDALSAAQAAVADADGKLDAETKRIGDMFAADQAKVDSAQGAFDKALAGTDDALIQKTAEQLHAAQSVQQAGSIMRNGLQVRLAARKTARDDLVQRAEAARAAWDDAWEEVRMAELNLAMLDADLATTRSLAAHLRFHAVNRSISNGRPSFLSGVGSAAFWFSAAHRAVRWNNLIDIGGNRSGPVCISTANLETMIREATLPAGAIVPTRQQIEQESAA